MHAADETLSPEENLKRCYARVLLMRAIADRTDGEALFVQRTAGDEPGIIGMMNPTFKIWFREECVFELQGEAELVRAIMDLTAEISDLFGQFEQRHVTTENLIRHAVTAKKFVTGDWLAKTAELVNCCLDTSSADGNLGGEFLRLGDRIVWNATEKPEKTVIVTH